MKLDSVHYCEDKGMPSEWRVDGCQLGDVNLIVGKNASGKSKILRAINLLSNLLSGDQNLKSDRIFKEWTLTFNSHSPDDKQVYVLIVDNGTVVEENLTIGSKIYLNRNKSGEGTIWANKLKVDIDFQTPVDEIAALKRRDSIQHPFFENLYIWASTLRYYQFGTDLGRSVFALVKSIKKESLRKEIDFKDTEQVIGIFKLGEEELGTPFIEAIKSDMLFIGYAITEVGTKTPSIFLEDETDQFIDRKPECLYVKESDLREKTEQYSMSQGMFRALSLIIQVNYSLLSGKSSCILIDDIGEGLDFERSSSMIKLLIDKAKTGLVQLIMTSNDRFIMNGVPLEFWSVIERKTGLAKLHNINNSKQIFDDFKFTGLNNFDFFASQFYVEGFQNEESINQ
jgi:AAA15 family ATPase/GTPase